MSTTRPKPPRRDPARPLASWDEVDLSLRRLGLIERRLAQAEAALTERVARLKEREATRCAPLEAERERLSALIEEFARRHRADLLGRSIELAHGRVGFRRAARLVVADEHSALARLKRLGLTGCLRVKESLDLVALRALPEEVLAEVGAERRESERFFYELARERLSAAAAAAA
jgi:phage host-nuclease inhibitor protein Gam